MDKLQDLQKLVDELSNQLAEGFFNTLKLVTSIINLTDRFHEGSHCIYVSDKSVQLGKDLGLNADMLFEVKIAGLLHDIGKTGFSDVLMSKNTMELTSSEFKEYSYHSDQGKQILVNHPGFDSIAEIVYQHHERLDGSGFPQGLQYKQIHPGAAIIAIVDTYHNGFYKLQTDKMVSSNTAKRYSTTDAYLKSTKQRFANVMNFLHRNIGILFDRKAVETFTGIVERDRGALGSKMVMRVPVNTLEPGWIMMEDFYSSYGLLIASRGETITDDKIRALIRFAENGEIPQKILVMK